VPDGSAIMSPSNRKNPDVTDAFGHFGWDVIAGYYTVRATKAGCHNPANPGQAFVETAVMTIPPPVTDLDLVLECPATSADFTPLTPARILDTRDGTGGIFTKVGPAGAVDVTVAGVGGVPATGVGAVVLNVTATEPTSHSWLSVFPAGEALPLASNLNFLPGQDVPNLVVAKVGAGGRVSVYNSVGSTHVIFDVVGWFSSGAASFTPLTPARILDTRDGTGGIAAKVGQASAVDVAVTGVGGTPASGVGAVVLNVTVTEPSAHSWLSVFPAGDPLPLASNLNFRPGQDVPNLVVAKVGANGKVTVYNSVGSTHVVFDVVGWFAAGATSFTPLTPARILDTRDGTGGIATKVGQATPVDVTVAGVGGVPATGVGAVVLNVTVTQPSAQSWLTVFPSGQSLPLASNLNFLPGQDVPNLVVAKVGAGGRVTVYNSAGSTHVVFDVVGWFAA
ncbi:MAG: hypothetical protein Q8K72_15780, partial [Acidimicrobiales bacterium]|nr:hypothetical protein [Acidimicrobiales bacterium]